MSEMNENARQSTEEWYVHYTDEKEDETTSQNPSCQ